MWNSHFAYGIETIHIRNIIFICEIVKGGTWDRDLLIASTARPGRPLGPTTPGNPFFPGGPWSPFSPWEPGSPLSPVGPSGPVGGFIQSCTWDLFRKHAWPGEPGIPRFPWNEAEKFFEEYDVVKLCSISFLHCAILNTARSQPSKYWEWNWPQYNRIFWQDKHFSQKLP